MGISESVTGTAVKVWLLYRLPVLQGILRTSSPIEMQNHNNDESQMRESTHLLQAERSPETAGQDSDDCGLGGSLSDTAASSQNSLSSAPYHSTPPQRGSSTPPQRGSSTPPQRGSSTPPQRGSSTPPQRGSSTPPQRGSSTPPQRGSSTPPQRGSSTPPQRGSPPPDRASLASAATLEDSSQLYSLTPLQDNALMDCLDEFYKVPIKSRIRLMRKVGLHNNKIEMARANHPCNVEEQFHEMLLTWHEEQGQAADINTLLKALLNLEHRLTFPSCIHPTGGTREQGLGVQKRQARVTVKYDRKELRKRLDVDRRQLGRAVPGKGIRDEVNIDGLLDLQSDQERGQKTAGYPSFME
ncbi:UNVERIFIED_CONTAM: hypothetical protein FKN15_069480 [Acipenser sinensis]